MELSLKKKKGTKKSRTSRFSFLHLLRTFSPKGRGSRESTYIPLQLTLLFFYPMVFINKLAVDIDFFK